jgi:hypothetical protein
MQLSHNNLPRLRSQLQIAGTTGARPEGGAGALHCIGTELVKQLARRFPPVRCPDCLFYSVCRK